MKRTLALLFCGALLLGTACEKKGTLPAATVNGVPISTQALVDELNAINSNPDYLDSLASGQAQQNQAVKGKAPGSFDISYAREVLREQIAYELVHAEVVRRGLHADDACQAAAAKDAYAAMPSGTSADGGKAEFEKFPAAYQQTRLQRHLDVLLLEADLSGQQCVADDAARSYYESHPDDFVQTCLSVIVVADQAAADAASARLKGGEDFGAVAKAVSADSSSAQGGDVGCITKGQLKQPELIDTVFGTAVGQISAPTALAGANGGPPSYLLIKVNDRKTPTLEDVRQQAEELAALASSNGLRDFLTKAVASSQISVDARYGTWNAANGAIDPPASETTTTTPTGGDVPALSDQSS